jgi:haloalkane dehalogenase
VSGAQALALAAREAPSELAGYPFAGRFLDVGGARMHYLDEGPRGAEPIVFVHGNPTWSYLWRRPVAALSPRHRCIAPDHVGMGRSDKPQGYPYRLAQHVANLERLVLELDLRRATLVVHDWGGPIGLGAFLRHPERLSRVLIANTAAFPLASFGGRAPWRIRACRTPLAGELLVRGLNAFAGAGVRMAVVRPLAPEVRAGYLAPYGSWAERIATHRFVRDIPLSPAHPSYGALLEVEAALPWLARVPVSLVWGERDWCFTPAFRREWQRRLPHATVHPLEGAGHYLVEDAPEEFQRHLEALLALPA